MFRSVALLLILAAALTGCALLEPADPNAATAADPLILAPANATAATVNHVHDGDTLFIAVPSDPNLKVRLIGMDTPEVGENLECFGDEATALLRSMLPDGAAVLIAPDVEPLDQYGRSLLYVFTAEGVSINLAMVASGAAEAVSIGQNTAYFDQLSSAETIAANGGVGMWGACWEARPPAYR